MPAIMADHDIEGQVQVLLRLLTSALQGTKEPLALVLLFFSQRLVQGC